MEKKKNYFDFPYTSNMQRVQAIIKMKNIRESWAIIGYYP